MLGLTLLFGVAGTMLVKSTGFGNDLFGNLVAVTGDAHQAQVAQDIFRADVRHELSLLIREDMRDVHALMSETVSTQVTTGSIVLGVCFSVLVEGYVQAAAAQWVLEVWALLTAWAAMLTFASLLLALYFQMAIKSAARERLLMKHRVFMPSDTVISSLGGYTLAEQVGHFHARLVGRLVGVAQHLSSLIEPSSKEPEEEVVAEEAPRSSLPGGVAEHKDQPPLPVDLQVGCEVSPCGAHEGCLLSDSRLLTVEARAGVEAWYDEEVHELTRHKVGELPGFLVGSTLVRQPWLSQQPERLRLRVHSEATMYVAARVYAADAADGMALLPNASPSMSMSPVALLPGMSSSGVASSVWSQAEMPKLLSGAHERFPWFQKVEGFSVYVAGQKESLPLYKVALQAPVDGDPVEVEVQWNFPGYVESLLVMLREGCVLTTEDEFPKRAFLQELEVLRPHLNFSTLYSQCGMSCLLLAVVFMHMARVSVVRPYPHSSDEVMAVGAATAVGLVGIWTRWRLAHAGSPFTDEGGVPAGDATSAARMPSAKCVGARSGGIVSDKLWRQRRQNWRKLAAFSCALGLLFTASLLWCLVPAVWVSLAAPPTPEPTPSSWTTWPVRWPVLFQPEAAVLSPDGLTLWAASAWAMTALDVHTEALSPSVRLPNAACGLALLGGRLVVADEESQLRIMQTPSRQAEATPASAQTLAARLSSEVAQLGAPLALPRKAANAGSVVALAGAPAMRLWAADPSKSVEDDIATDESIIAVAFAGQWGPVVLYSVSAAANGSTPALELEALLQLQALPVRQAGEASVRLQALHLAATGPVPARSGQAWLWAASSDGRLSAQGLSNGIRVDMEPPWPVEEGRTVTALTGNATHLLAFTASGQARVAAFEALIPPSLLGTASEL